MTYRDVFIGKLSATGDPLEWDGDWTCKVPYRESPYFPPGHSGADPFSRLIKKIEDGKLPGKQVDWGGWAAKATKKEILDFIAEAYNDHSWYIDPEIMPHLYDQMQSLRSYVHSLPEDAAVALVACEQ